MSEPIPLRPAQVARTWQEAADGVLTDLIRFATYRSIGFDVELAAAAMYISLPLAERYETTITRLMADLNSGAGPDATEPAPDPQKEIHSK